MTEEEAYYWFSRVTEPHSGRRGRRRRSGFFLRQSDLVFSIGRCVSSSLSETSYGETGTCREAPDPRSGSQLRRVGREGDAARRNARCSSGCGASANLRWRTSSIPGRCTPGSTTASGVCHVAGLLARQLGPRRDDETGWSGWRPCSTTWGTARSATSPRTSWTVRRPDVPAGGQKKEKIHELVTAYLIANDPRSQDSRAEETCEKIVKLLSIGHGQPALQVDRLRAARRRQAGLPAARRPVLRGRVRHLRHPPTPSLAGPRRGGGGEGIDDRRRTAVHAVEQYVLAKYYMTTNVYRHRVRLITDQMIVRAIILGDRGGWVDELRKIYAFDNCRRSSSQLQDGTMPG